MTRTYLAKVILIAALLGIGWALDDTATPTQINLTAEDFPNSKGATP